MPPFVQRLRELNWIEGRTVTIETRWGNSRASRLAEMATESIELKVNVTPRLPGPLQQAVRRRSCGVFALLSDPVGIGIVNSLKRPGGNVTGLSNQSSDLGAKKLELLREVSPQLRRLAIMINVGNSGSKLEVGEVQAAASALGLETVLFEILRAEDIAPAIEKLKGDAEALYVPGDRCSPASRAHQCLGSGCTAAYNPWLCGRSSGRPAVYPLKKLHGPARRAADYVDKIRAAPRPAKCRSSSRPNSNSPLTSKTAKLLGLEISPQFLARVHEVIE